MIMKLSHVNVFVEDQDRAKAFYTEKLGFEVRSDAPMDGFRWLTVGPKDQPDLNILLARPQPPMFSEEDAATLLGLVAKGVIGAGVMETDDIKGAYEELKGKGVTFLQEPAERPYGIEALFRDDSGNWFSLNQHKRYGGGGARRRLCRPPARRPARDRGGGAPPRAIRRARGEGGVQPTSFSWTSG